MLKYLSNPFVIALTVAIVSGIVQGAIYIHADKKGYDEKYHNLVERISYTASERLSTAKLLYSGIRNNHRLDERWKQYEVSTNNWGAHLHGYKYLFLKLDEQERLSINKSFYEGLSRSFYQLDACLTSKEVCDFNKHSEAVNSCISILTSYLHNKDEGLKVVEAACTPMGHILVREGNNFKYKKLEG
ncbi:MAG: hypothetical protein VX154_05255 [Pseudomonadota bacterium]|nr:hypothetical protein [Pseudomonadota bacterium]